MTLAQLFAGFTRGRHRAFAFGLLLVLVVLVPLADARSPDQTWLTGIYDAGDFDDVVVAVISATAVVSGLLLLSRKPADLSAAMWPENAVLLVTACSDMFTLGIRAPPSSTRMRTS